MNAKNLKDTIVPKSDQLNSEQLLGGSMTITVTGVSRGAADQPVIIAHNLDATRPYKPCKTMRKLLIAAWGDDGAAWIGKSMTLYNDTEVKWAGEKVGGIRISHLSDIPSAMEISLTATKGKKKLYRVEKLTDDTSSQRSRLIAAALLGTEAFNKAWAETPTPIMHKLGKPWKEEQVAIAAQHDAPVTETFE